MAAGEPAPASKAAGLVPPYNDVAPGDPDTVFIKYISQKGIISGFPDGSYHPAEGLTRAQAAVVICKAAALKTPAANNQTFKDVSLAHWSAPYVDAAVKAGYIKGFPDGTYKPEEKLTRAQGISLIMRLCTQKERAELPSVQDMNNQHWAAKDMGTAIALKMIETTKDGKQIHPEADMTRASLARALAILLTKDPGLNQVKLTGKLTEIKGQVTLTRNNQTQNLKNDTTICEADIIKTGSDGRARIIYPDGSGTLIEENSEIAIKKAEGKNYIKQDGTPGTAVEFLNLDLNKGTLFGALSTKTENEKEKKQAGISHIFASREALTQLAAADNTQPWYQTAEKKKVKVKVDMPWGVAAVRGTFIKVSVNPDGTCDVSCLTGSAELSGSSGGLTSLGGGQSSSIGSQGGAPSQAAAMSEADKAAFAREQEWVVNTALLVDTNKAAEVLVKTDDSQTVEQQAETTVKTVIEALKASGIQLRPEVIEKLKEDIQSKLNEEAAKSLISAVDKAGVTNNTNSNLSNLSNLSNSSDSSNSSSYIAYNTAGTYGGQSASSVQTITGTVVVNVPGVTLQNLIITGNLVLAAGIGEGDVTLNNVKVQGAATVNGGGSSSVNIADSQINTVLVQKTGSSVRIVVSGSTAIGNLTLNSGAILAEESNLTGTGFSNILTGLSLPEGTRIVLSGNFASINIASPGLIIEVESGTIGQIRLAETATGTSLNLASGVTVSALEVNASNVQVGGAGQITSASINASGVTIAQTPASWTVKEGITSNIGGQNVSGSSGQQEPVTYGQITYPGDSVAQLTEIRGTTDGRGGIVVGGGVFIHNDTLNRWVKPKRNPVTGAIHGKTYILQRNENCIIGPFSNDSVTGAVYSQWTLDLTPLELPVGYDYSVYLRVGVNGTPYDDQDVVTVHVGASGAVDPAKSSVSGSGDNENGTGYIEITVKDTQGSPVGGLDADQFSAVVNGVGPISFAQAPFWYFAAYSGGVYYTAFTGSSSTLTDIKVGGVLIEDRLELTITGGAVLTGTVQDNNGQNLAGVHVSAVISSMPQEVVNAGITDTNGYYCINVPSILETSSDALLVRFNLPGYSASNQTAKPAAGQTITANASMTLDNESPTGITINAPNKIERSTPCVLTASGGPLSDQSWHNVFTIIQSNTNAGNNWITFLSGSLGTPTISLDGNSMTFAYNASEGSALINKDFVIPAYLVVDRAGNQGVCDIIIDSCRPWIELGGANGVSNGNASALSLTACAGEPFVAYGDFSGEYGGKATVKDFNSGSWAAVGNPGFTGLAVSETGLGLDSYGILQCAFITNDKHVNLMSYNYDHWESFYGGYTGTSARFLQFSLDNNRYPLAAFEDTVGGYVYGTVKHGKDGWQPFARNGYHVEQFFYEGTEALQGLSMDYNCSNGIMYIAYIDSAGQVHVKKSLPDVYGDMVAWGELNCIYGTYSINDKTSKLSLRLDSTGTPYLAFIDSGGLRVAKYVDGAWNDLSPAAAGNFTGSSIVRLFMYNDSPYLCFTDSQNWITVLHYNNAQQVWEAVGEPAFAQTAGELQFYVDGGVPYVAFIGQDSKAHLFKMLTP